MIGSYRKRCWRIWLIPYKWDGKHLESRLALQVTSLDELERKLENFLAGTEPATGVFHGQIRTHREAEPASTTDANSHETVRDWISKQPYEQILERWVKGWKVDWRDLYQDTTPLHRISLPAYPFYRDRYWVGEVASGVGSVPLREKPVPSIHPLLHENTSDLAGQRFSVSFTGDEFYVKDHRLQGRKVLPAAAYLEMAREAVWQSVKSFSGDISGIQLNHITWAQPIIVGEKGLQVHLELYLEENGTIRFEVYQNDPEDAAEREIYCQGGAVLDSPAEAPSIGETGIAALQKACNKREFAKTECYKAFQEIGFEYGPAHQGLEQVYVGDNQLVARVTLPPVVFDPAGTFVLHPALLDAALQASLLWNRTDDHDPLKMFLPAAVENVRIYRNIPVTAWVVIGSSGKDDCATSGERLLDIDVLTEKGDVSVRLQGISFRNPALKGKLGLGPQSFETLLMVPGWKPEEVSPVNTIKGFAKHLVILCYPESSREDLFPQLPGIETRVLAVGGADDFPTVTAQVFEQVQTLLRGKAKGNVLVQVLIPAEGEGKLYAALAGLLKTTQKENPGFFGQLISITSDKNRAELEMKIQENRLAASDLEIRYQSGSRQVWEWNMLEDHPVTDAAETGSHPWKDRGVYLITGGAGGLGFIFAREIARKAGEVTLVLTGRSALNLAKQTEIAALQKLGANVTYRQLDVTDSVGVQQLIQSIRKEFGGLNGIIHSAGVTRDNFLIRKTAAEWHEVLAPKVKGLQNLDIASKDEALDVFILFSSITGVLGNPGQADYAVANAFMDEFARYRNELVHEGVRRGHTLSVNWSLWQEGGMQVDQETENYLFDSMGMVPLPTGSGIRALYQALLSGHDQVMVMAGNREKISEKILLRSSPIKSEAAESSPAPVQTDHQVQEEIIAYFKKLLSSVIKLPTDQIKPHVPMEEYGIDSVMVMKMTGKLEKVFGTLSKTLFFEYQTIQELAQHFREEHYPQLAAVLGLEAKGSGSNSGTGYCSANECSRFGYPAQPSADVYACRNSYKGPSSPEKKIPSRWTLPLWAFPGNTRKPITWKNSGKTSARAKIALPKFRLAAGTTPCISTRTKVNREKLIVSGAAS